MPDTFQPGAKESRQSGSVEGAVPAGTIDSRSARYWRAAVRAQPPSSTEADDPASAPSAWRRSLGSPPERRWRV